MKKRFLFLGLLVVVVLGLSALPWALAQEDDVNAPAVVAGSDEDPNAPPEMIVPEEFRTPGGGSVAASTTTLYFTPQDNDSNSTVLFFYNTGVDPATVFATSYAEDGSVYANFDVTVPVRHFVRVCSDAIANPPPPSWVNTVLWNFKDFSVYAKLVVPEGIKLDGYVVWTGSASYNPNVGYDTVPIRLSSDPLTVFLPEAFRGYP